MQSPQHNHRHHSRQKQHDDERVENAEPLDVRVRHGLEDVIPTRAPFDRIVLHEAHRVGVCDVNRLSVLQRRSRNLQRRLAVAVGLAGVVFDGPRRDFHGHDASTVLLEGIAPLFLRAAVVRDDQVDVVERIVRAGFVVERVGGAAVVVFSVSRVAN